MTQVSIFDPIPCKCGAIHEAHHLPNYEPPVWVIGIPPKCGENVYAETREGAVEAWRMKIDYEKHEEA